VISKDDLYLWKSDPVTQAWFEACEVRVEDAKEQLAVQAGISADFDNYIRGMIAAYREMVTFTVEDIEE